MRRLGFSKQWWRNSVVRSMRACVAQERLPWIIKALLVNGLQRVLRALGIESDARPIESDYGMRFTAGSDGSWLNSVLRVRGVWDPALSEFIVAHVREGDVCVDAGANCGYFSLLLAQQVGASGKVIAIEAVPENVRRLRANVLLNNAVEVIDVVMAACARQEGRAVIHVHPDNDAWSRLEPPAEGHTDHSYMGAQWAPMTVRADTLGALVGSWVQRVSFLKVHIEGAEALVAPDIPATFSHPNLVVALLAKEPNITSTLQPFKENGFYIYDRHNDYRWVFERKVPLITEAAYSDFDNEGTSYVLLSRQPLPFSPTRDFRIR